MIKPTKHRTPADLLPAIERMWSVSKPKIEKLHHRTRPGEGTPVFTINGEYTARGWTEWTEGFKYGASILQFDATGDEEHLRIGREATRDHMASHVSHRGVHDHGFNNVSTYGALLRLMKEGRIAHNDWEETFYALALKVSGAVQAMRWTSIGGDAGYIHSFNGPHSLFIDTMRSLRSLSVAHRLGHVLMSEHDERINLLHRMVRHAETTAQYVLYYGEGRDAYDVRGRGVHEAIFNVVDGHYRCPSSQQGYSPFSTWTRGQAWAVCGYPEQLEYLETVADEELEAVGGRAHVTAMMERAALAVCDFYVDQTPTCGVPYWDTGAPNLHRLGDWANQPADPFNDFEPVDASAAAIAAQGLFRMGRYLETSDPDRAARYTQAALQTTASLLEEPYLSLDPAHEGLLLHSIYHRPNNWDHIPPGSPIPRGEACMWGDYHLRELALYVQRLATGAPYYQFFQI